MNAGDVAAFLSRHGHELAMEQRDEFQRETARQDAERAERAQRRLERQQARRTPPSGERKPQ